MSFLFFFQILSLLLLASGKPVLLPRQAPGGPQAGQNDQFVDIKLSVLGNTTLKAEVTNIATQSLRIIKSGSLFDSLPTRKVHIEAKDGETPPFLGVQVEYINSHLSSDAFMDIPPQQTVETTFNVAETYELSPSTEYSAFARGSLEYALGETNKTTFSKFPYESNEITFNTPETLPKILDARSTLISCDGEYNDIIQAALTRTAEMAKAAAADARNATSSLFEKYFMTNNEADRNSVADRMDAIVTEATTTGKLTYYCQPTSTDYCGSNIAALTYPYSNKVVNCQGYYDTTAESSVCGYLDQAAITLHEYTHATGIYAPGTEDVIYGYPAVLSLSSSQALANADNYAYYASAVYLGCDDAAGGVPDDSTSAGDSGTDAGSDNNGNTGGTETGGTETGDNSDNNNGSDSTNDNDGPGDITSQLPGWLRDWLSRHQGKGDGSSATSDNTSSSNDSWFTQWLWGQIEKQQNEDGEQDGGPITITVPLGSLPTATSAPAALVSGDGVAGGFGGGKDCDKDQQS